MSVQNVNDTKLNIMSRPRPPAPVIQLGSESGGALSVSAAGDNGHYLALHCFIITGPANILQMNYNWHIMLALTPINTK